MAPMDEGLVLLLVGAILARASASRSARRARACRCSSRSSGSGCCSARTAPAGSSSTTPSSRARSESSGSALILYEGGLQTSWRRLREVAVPAALLSTVGVVVSTLLTGVAAQALFDLTWLEAFLLGAVVASTTRRRSSRRCASRTSAVGSRARSRRSRAATTRWRSRSRSGLIAWIEQPDSYGARRPRAARRPPDRARPRRRCRARSASRRGSSRASRRRSARSRPSLRVAAAALVVRRRRHDRRQRLPRRLPRRPRRRQHAVALPAPARRVPRRPRVRRAGRAVRPARPARVPATTYRSGALRARAGVPADARRAARRRVGVDALRRRSPGASALLLGWAGLRGAVPIVLATFVLSSRRAAQRNDLQRRLLRRHRLDARPGNDARVGRPAARADLVGAAARRAAARGRADRASSTSSSSPSPPTTPSTARPCASSACRVRRSSRASAATATSIPPRGSTIIQAGDQLFDRSSRHGRRPDLEDVFTRWRRLI